MVSRIDQMEEKLAMAGKPGHPRLTVDGQEIPDSVPVAPNIRTKRVDNITRRIREVLKGEQLRKEALEAGFETFEEADNFDVPDDPVDPSTPYELVFEPPVEAVRERHRSDDREANRRTESDSEGSDDSPVDQDEALDRQDVDPPREASVPARAREVARGGKADRSRVNPRKR